MNLRDCICVCFSVVSFTALCGDVTSDLDFNTYAGSGAFEGTSFSENNTAYGRNSMSYGKLNDWNVSVGADSVVHSASNKHNIAIGYGAMSYTTNMDSCIAIGAGALENSRNLTNAVQIGRLIYSDGKGRMEISPSENLNEGAKPLIWDKGVTKIGGKFVYIYPKVFASLDYNSSVGIGFREPISTYGEQVSSFDFGTVTYQATPSSIIIWEIVLFNKSNYPFIEGVVKSGATIDYDGYGNLRIRPVHVDPARIAYKNHFSDGVYSKCRWYEQSVRIEMYDSPRIVQSLSVITYLYEADTPYEEYRESSNKRLVSSSTVRYRPIANDLEIDESPVRAKYDISTKDMFKMDDGDLFLSPATTRFVERWTPNIRYENGEMNVYDENGVKLGKLNFTAD